MSNTLIHRNLKKFTVQILLIVQLVFSCLMYLKPTYKMQSLKEKIQFKFVTNAFVFGLIVFTFLSPV